MKSFLISFFLLMPLIALAQNPATVGSGTLETAPGIGGYADAGFAFAKGDVIHIDAHSHKKLQRMMALLYPDRELGKVESTDAPQLTFTMPQDGIIVFRFISDRSGTDKVTYTVTRKPASTRLSHYDTRVVWLKPANGAPGALIPVRADSHYDKSRVVKLIH